MPSPRRSSGITLQSFYAANISASRNPRHRIHQILSRTTAHRSDRLTMQPDRPSFDHNPLLAAKLARNLAAVNNHTLATLVVIFGGVMPALIYLIGVVDDFGTLMVVRRADFLSVFDEAQRDALAMLFLKLRDAQNTAAEVLWGVWLFPLAVLVYKSHLVPRFLGVWLAIGGAAYLALSMAGTLWPQYQGTVFTISQPATFCEVALTLWLVIKGTEPQVG
jgi:Domain of unknown function (DUF4386)